jgi:hypothetical protein
VFDAPRHDEEFALFQPNVPVAKLHAKAALDHQEQLVLVIVVVPDELALEFDQLDELAVQLASDLRLPVGGEAGKLVAEIDLFGLRHGASPGGVVDVFPSCPHDRPFPLPRKDARTQGADELGY